MIRGKKDKINVLMNIDSYFGEHQGRLGPMLVFLCVSAVPFIVYIFLFSRIIPLKLMLILEVLFTIRMALFILGKENEKLEIYKKAREDEFATANDLIRTAHVHDDGLIEYENGRVAYIISAFTTTYFSDSVLSIDLERFLSQLKDYEHDEYCHLVVDEFRLQDEMESMSVYEDKELMKERIMFYIDQDTYCSEKSELYRINILVKASKYDWKVLRTALDGVIKSEYAKVFKVCYICNKDQASMVMSRDICAYIDIADMLKGKYHNEDYYGSRVLFYGDDIPEEYKTKKDKVDMEERRVVIGNERD